MNDNYFQGFVEALYAFIKYQNNIKDAEFYIKFQSFCNNYLVEKHLKIQKKAEKEKT
jgi:hypothetical protein